LKKIFKVVTLKPSGNFVSSSSYGNYCLTYKLNLSTLAVNNTYGIFCFDNYDDAKKYLHSRFNLDVQFARKILEVRAYGKPQYPKYISKTCFCSAFYSTETKNYFTKPPEGTVCYPKIVPIKIL